MTAETTPLLPQQAESQREPLEDEGELIKMCVDRRLSPEEDDDVQFLAAQANPANEVKRERLDPQTGGAIAIAFEFRKCWQPGAELHIRFLGGLPEVQQKVAEIAAEWMQFANVHLIFDNAPDAPIRVAFKRGGSWSMVGMDALKVAADQPTMNLGWLNPQTSDEEYHRVVLHEFGHALGAIHEHQSPHGAIPWNRAKVIATYAGPPNNWDEAKIIRNVLNRYDEESVNASAFDPHSIMLYPVPRQLTLNGFEIPWRNAALSDLDKAWVCKMYGPPPGQIECEEVPA